MMFEMTEKWCKRKKRRRKARVDFRVMGKNQCREHEKIRERWRIEAYSAVVPSETIPYVSAL